MIFVKNFRLRSVPRHISVSFDHSDGGSSSVRITRQQHFNHNLHYKKDGKCCLSINVLPSLVWQSVHCLASSHSHVWILPDVHCSRWMVEQGLLYLLFVFTTQFPHLVRSISSLGICWEASRLLISGIQDFIWPAPAVPHSSPFPPWRPSLMTKGKCR